ncbi:hypothetical protein LCGC14_2830220, partial [marine sediment metagenome]
MAYKGENVKIRRKQGGDALEFASGAEVDFLTGALTKFGGTAVDLAAAVEGVAAGYKIAR